MILMASRRREPPSVSSVTQHVLRGTLEVQVQADIAYTVHATIKFHLGPVFFVLKGRDAALSMRDLIDKLAPVIDELYNAFRRVSAIDLGRLREYVAQLRDQLTTLGPAERFLFQRLEGLERLAAIR